MDKYWWGLPVPEDVNYVRKYGARTIYHGPYTSQTFEFLHDRQSYESTEKQLDEKEPFFEWINGSFIPYLKVEVGHERIGLMDDTTVKLISDDDRFIGIASPRSSGGYMYICCWESER